MIQEIADIKPEQYETFNTDAVFSNETATMNDAEATMNDIIVTMGGSDTTHQYGSPEMSVEAPQYEEKPEISIIDSEKP